MNAPLIGRDEERTRLHDGLRPGGAHVLNVTGPRGVGKTALMRSVLERASRDFSDMRQLELHGDDPGDALAAVRDVLAQMPVALPAAHGGRSLLVLHRGDRLAPVAPQLVELAAHDGALTVLVESVPELRADGCAGLLLGPLGADAASELFRRSAASVGAGLDDATETVELIDRICDSVDRNPLAIELAACRLSFLSLPVLEAVVSDPRRALGVLTAPLGAGPDIAGVGDLVLASQRMSSEQAQHLLELLAVFRGPFTLEAMEAVSDGVVPQRYDALGELLDLRLVELDPTRADGTFRLSRLVHGFAADRLEASGLATDARDRHAAHYAELARRAAVAVEDADEDTARETLGDDFAECVAALTWLGDHDPGTALRLAADLGWDAHRRGEIQPLERLMGELCASGVGDPSTRRDALLWLVQLESWGPASADRAQLIAARVAEAVGLARETRETRDEQLPLLQALRSQYIAYASVGDAAAAVAAVTEGHRLALELGHTRWAGRFEVSLASMHSNLRQFDQAAEYARSGLDRALRTDDRRTIVHAALVLHSLPPAAVPHPEQLVTLESALALSRDLDDAQRELGVLATLAVTAVQRGDTSAAAEWIRARQQRFRRLDLLYGLPISVMLAVEVAKLRGDLRTGARLHGAVAAHAEPLLAIMAPGHAALYRRSLETIRMQLGRTGFDAATAEGATLGRDGTLLALATYLDEIDDSSPSAGAAAPNRSADGLTAREAQVLALLVRGLRNKEIATDLRITPKTVMHHTGAIYRKLGVRNRAEAATAAARRGLVPLD